MTAPTPPDDGLRAAVEALADEWAGNLLIPTFATARLRSALAAHPAPTPAAGEGDGLAEAWDAGYTAGHSNAMRRMSDEPNAPTSPNPYSGAKP